MRRVMWIGLAAALIAAAALVAEPETVATPTSFPNAVVVEGSSSAAGVWYCPMASASFEEETEIISASAETASVELGFPNPIPGEAADTAQVQLVAADAKQILVSDIVLRGDAPALVEYSTPRGGVFSIISGDGTSYGDACASSAPKTWHLPGGATADGQRTSVRLFNPFAQVAIVTVTVTSDIGIAPLTELESLVVPANTWRDISLDQELRFRDVLAITVIGEEGLVLPALRIGDNEDEASWIGTGLSTTWELPVVKLAGMEASLYVNNPGNVDVVIEIDLLTPEGRLAGAMTQTVLAGSPAVIPVVDLTEGPMGLSLRADGPISVVTVARGAGGLAGTPGAPSPAAKWLLPGSNAAAGSVTSLWLLNTGDEQATVTVRPLGVNAQPEKLVLASGVVRQVLVDSEAVAFLIDSTNPISAAWSSQSSTAATFVSGRVVSD